MFKRGDVVRLRFPRDHHGTDHKIKDHLAVVKVAYNKQAIYVDWLVGGYGNAGRPYNKSYFDLWEESLKTLVTRLSFDLYLKDN